MALFQNTLLGFSEEEKRPLWAVAGKGGVKLPTVGASGSFWGQFGI